MSRSNPHVNAPSPAVRWFEWNGEHGTVRYYDKDAKQNVDVALPFAFLVLDELGSVRGWHDPSQSGIYSNEVRDTRTDVLVVKSYKGGTLAEGVYKDIKDRVNTVGGQFNANCYIAFKQNGGLAIGSLRFKGAALGGWMEFRKNNRAALYSKAVEIVGFIEGKKGRIVFRVPTFATRDVSEATNKTAGDMDVVLQTWLSEYFKRRTNDRTDPPSANGSARDAYDDPPVDDYEPAEDAPITVDDIPF